MMASITERSGRYTARVRRDGFATVTKTFTLKKEAQAWARQVEAAMEGGRWQEDPAAKMPTLAEAIALYQKAVVASQKSAKTSAYRYKAMKSEVFASKPIDKVTPADLSAWRRRLEGAGKSPGTVLGYMALMSGLFTWAVRERQWLTDNPLARVSKPRAPEGRARTLTDQEWAYLMRSTTFSTSAWLAPALTLLAHSAMRRGELFRLKTVDINYGDRTAHLSDTKNGFSRDVPLCPVCLRALGDLVRMAEEEGRDRMVPVGNVGTVSTIFIRTVRRAKALYAADCEAIGAKPVPGFLADVHLHDLRHRAISLRASQGLSTFELQQVSGHRSLAHLNRYVHGKPSDVAQKLAALAA